MGLLTKLHTAGRASVVAVILAGAALAAMPVEAAPLKGFSLDVKPQGDQKGMQLRNFKNDDNAFFFWCLTDKQIRQGLRAYGFFDVDRRAPRQEPRPRRGRVGGLVLLVSGEPLLG